MSTQFLPGSGKLPISFFFMFNAFAHLVRSLALGDGSDVHNGSLPKMHEYLFKYNICVHEEKEKPKSGEEEARERERKRTYMKIILHVSLSVQETQ